MAIIEVQDLTDYLGRDLSNDDGAAFCVDAAIDIVREESGQEFTLGTTTVTLDGTGTNALLLPQVPATAIGTVTVNSGTVTDYVLDTERSILFRGGTDTSADSGFSDDTPSACWPVGPQNVRVTYTHGYGTADIPTSVRMVALSVASRLLIQGPSISETVGETSTTYAVPSTDLTDGEKRILRRSPR